MRKEDQALSKWIWIAIIIIAILIAINSDSLINLLIEKIGFLITTVGEWIRITTEELINVMNS